MSEQAEETQRNLVTQALWGGRHLPPGYIILWLVTLLSLSLNVFSIRQMVITRQAAAQVVTDAIFVLEGLQDEVFSYTLAVDDTIDFAADLPVDETIPLIIDEQLPINTTVTVPIRTPLGNTSARVPISTIVPVNIETEVTINQTFEVQAAVPVNLDVPIMIAISDTPFAGTLTDVIVRLQTLSADLNSPLIGGGNNNAQTQVQPQPQVIQVTATPQVLQSQPQTPNIPPTVDTSGNTTNSP